MPRVCSVCSHPGRDEIDAAVAMNRGSIRGIARQHRVSPDALERHAARHLPQTLARAVEAREDARAEDLATKTRRLEEDARRLLKKAEDEGDYRCAIGAVKTLLDVVALLHRVSEDQRAAVRDVLRSPSWARFKGALLAELAPYPAALAAVARLAEAPAGDAGAEESVRSGPEDRLGLATRVTNLLAGAFAKEGPAAALTGSEEEPDAARL